MLYIFMHMFYMYIFLIVPPESAKGSDSEDDFLRQKAKKKAASDSDSDSDVGARKCKKNLIILHQINSTQLILLELVVAALSRVVHIVHRDG